MAHDGVCALCVMKSPVANAHFDSHSQAFFL